MVRAILQLTGQESAKLSRVAKRKGWSRAKAMRQALRLLPNVTQAPKRHWGLLRGTSPALRKNYRDDDR